MLTACHAPRQLVGGRTYKTASLAVLQFRPQGYVRRTSAGWHGTSLSGLARPARGQLKRPIQRRIVADAASGGPRGDLRPGDVIGRKYEVQEVLGRGGNAITYKCKDLGSGREVAVKALSLRSLKDWKQLELFEREAQVLKSLAHPSIPRYLEYFEEDSERDRGFYLVQELAAGRSLGDMVAGGWRADEAEVERIAGEMLGVLQYLGSRRPPVIHRDIKPENIVIEGGRTGGRVLLVDFGGVQGAASAGDRLGSTVVGTYGYMAPEQFRGSAQPASDLYGLGATLLFLLSGRHPSEFPQDRLRLDFSEVPMSPRLRLLLGGLLDPLVEDRMSAAQALAALTGQAPVGAPGGGRGGSVRGARWGSQRQSAALARQRQLDMEEGVGLQPPYMYPSQQPRGGFGGGGRPRKPAGSRVVLTQQGPRLEIEIPPAGLKGGSLATGAFAIAWNAFVAFWTVSALAGGGVFFALFSIPFWAAGYSLARGAIAGQFMRERLQIGLQSWRLQQQLGLASGNGVDWEGKDGIGRKEVKGRSADLSSAAVIISGYVNGVPQTQLVLKEGVNSYVMGEGLEPEEQEWLANVINTHIQQNKQLGEELEAFPASLDAKGELPAGSGGAGFGTAAALGAGAAAAAAGAAAAGAGAGWRESDFGSDDDEDDEWEPVGRQQRGGSSAGGSNSGGEQEQEQATSYAQFLGQQAAEAAAAAAAEARAAGERAAASAEAAAEAARERAANGARAAAEAAEAAAEQAREAAAQGTATPAAGNHDEHQHSHPGEDADSASASWDSDGTIDVSHSTIDDK